MVGGGLFLSYMWYIGNDGTHLAKLSHKNYNDTEPMTHQSPHISSLSRAMGIGVALCMLCTSAFAQTDAKPIQIASADSASKRFISLQSARPNGLRSDTASMKNGYMRLDREMLIVNTRHPRSNVIVTRPQTASTDAAATKDDAAGIFSQERTTRVSGHAWPIAKSAKQYISSGYGMRKDPFHGQQRFHGGIDIATAPGTAVLASADGVVSETGAKGGFGNHISITHRDGSISMYGHLSAENVRVGQRVRQGQQIGKVGSTGRSTGPHLDFRVKQKGQTVDPMRVLARNSMPGMSRDVASNTVTATGGTDARGARRLPQRPMVIRVR